MKIRPLIWSLSLLVCIGLTGCYDDDDLWESVDRLEERVTTIENKIAGINADITSLRDLVAGVSSGAVITGCTQTDYGYLLVLSDGRSVQVRNGRDGVDGKDGQNGKDGEDGADGKDGRDGTDAPAIGIREDSDGVYYWTVTMEGTTRWLTDANGNKMPVCGKDGQDGLNGKDGQDGSDGRDGQDGRDGVTPVIGVSGGYWTVDYGDGPTFLLDENGNKIEVHPTATVAGLFTSVVPGEDEITFNMTDGTTFTVPRVDNFGLTIDTSDPYFKAGQERTYSLKLTGVADLYVTTVTDGWSARISGSSLVVKAPEAADEENVNCDVRLIVVNKRHDMRAFKISVKVRLMGERILTFEDEDYKGSGNMLGKKDWSSLIDNPQYGGALLYPKTNTLYHWYDEGNTELYSEFPNTYGDYQFWGGGGHAVSNYVDMTLSNGDYQHQLAVYYRHSNGNGGHDGSKNFCIQNGYFDTDPSGLAQNRNIACLTFKDGKARVIKEMWVTNTTYAVNVWKNGNSLSPAGKDNDYFKLVAYGYDVNDRLVGVQPSLELAKGGTFISVWTRLDLSAMGEIKKIVLNLESNVGNGYGMSVPAYVAIDDIKVLTQLN